MKASAAASVLLLLRALVFLVLFPGTVTGYIPYAMLRAEGRLRAPEPSPRTVAAGLLVAFGAGVLLACVWQFFARGRGTLAPVDPPKHLVVSGLYRVTRNPMYNGVVLALLGEAWLFGSMPLLVYAGCVLLFFHLFVVLYEERALAGQFGESYAAYRAAVPRWGFTLRPYAGPVATIPR